MQMIFWSVGDVSAVRSLGWIVRETMNNTWGLVIAVSAFLIEVIVYGVGLSFGIYVIELQKEFDQGLSLISAVGSIQFGFQLSAGEYFFFLPLQGYTCIRYRYTNLTFCHIGDCWGCLLCPIFKIKNIWFFKIITFNAHLTWQIITFCSMLTTYEFVSKINFQDHWPVF